MRWKAREAITDTKVAVPTLLYLLASQRCRQLRIRIEAPTCSARPPLLVLCCNLLSCTVIYCSMLLYYTILYDTFVTCCTVLYCIMLQLGMLF